MGDLFLIANCNTCAIQRMQTISFVCCSCGGISSESRGSKRREGMSVTMASLLVALSHVAELRDVSRLASMLQRSSGSASPDTARARGQTRRSLHACASHPYQSSVIQCMVTAMYPRFASEVHMSVIVPKRRPLFTPDSHVDARLRLSPSKKESIAKRWSCWHDVLGAHMSVAIFE